MQINPRLEIGEQGIEYPIVQSAKNASDECIHALHTWFPRTNKQSDKQVALYSQHHFMQIIPVVHCGMKLS